MEPNEIIIDLENYPQSKCYIYGKGKMSITIHFNSIEPKGRWISYTNKRFYTIEIDKNGDIIWDEQIPESPKG